MKNVKTDCVLESEPLDLNYNTPINNYAEVWWRTKKFKNLINTGLHVDIRRSDLMAALNRHSYKIQPMNYADILTAITESGAYRIQIIAAIEEPKELTWNDLYIALGLMKEIDRGLPVRLKDIITEKEYFFQGINRTQIKIMEVQRADKKD